MSTDYSKYPTAAAAPVALNMLETFRAVGYSMEAARFQFVPYDFFFESNRTAAFKQIGNTVPVLMAEGIAKKLKI